MLTFRQLLVSMAIAVPVGMLATYAWHSLIRYLAGAKQAERRQQFYNNLKSGDKVTVVFRGQNVETVIDLMGHHHRRFTAKMSDDPVDYHIFSVDRIVLPPELA